MLWAELLRLAESRSSPPPHAADCNSSELVALTAGGELLRLGTSSVLRTNLAEWGQRIGCALGRGGRPGGSAIFDAERHVAGLPSVRPARFFEPQEAAQNANLEVVPVGCGNRGGRLLRVETGNKRRCASLRGERLRPARPFGSQEHSMFLSGSGCALRGWAEGPARRPGGSTNRKSTAHSSSARPLAPLMRRSRRGRRFLSESRYSLSTPKHCPVLTSLRLRCRSAAFSRALRDSSIFGYRRKS